MAIRISAPQRKSTHAVYDSRVGVFNSWTEDNGLDGSNLTIQMIAQFFEYLFDVKKRKPGLFRGYKTALADHFSPTGRDIKNTQPLLRFYLVFYRSAQLICRL